MKKLLFVMLFLCGVAFDAHPFFFKHDPFRSWETVHTENFYVHYPKGYHEVALKIAAMCEEAYLPVSKTVRYSPGKTHVVIHTDSDVINAFAAPFPWRIEVFLTEPQDNWLGSGDEFLRVLIVHEFTHIAHMRKKRGLTRATYFLLGDNAFLWHKITPLWFQEGIATYNETYLTRGGRGRNPRFLMEFNASIYPHQKSLYSTSFLSRVEYPIGMWYYSGFEMHNHLVNQHGSGVWADILDSYTAVPFCGFNYHVRKITSKDVETHYRDIARLRRNRLQDDTRHIITQSSDKQMHLSPVWATDSTILFHKKGLAELPKLKEINIKNGEQREVLTIDFYYETNSFAIRDGIIVYSHLSVHPLYSAVSYHDIHTYNMKTGDKRRVTRRKNISSANFHPTENKVVAVESLFPNNQVVEVSLETGEIKPIFRIVNSSVLNPKYSPCGEFLAFTLSDENGITEIAVYSFENKTYTKVTNSGQYHVNNPTWSPDGRYIYFNGVYNGRFSIMRVNLLTKQEQFGFSSLYGVESVDISKDGNLLVYSQYTKDGFRIAVKNINEITFQNISRNSVRQKNEPLVSLNSENENEDSVIEHKIKGYNPFRTIAVPQGWMPLIIQDVENFIYGFHAQSNDPLGRHSWNVNVLRRFGDEPRWFGRFDYQYRRFWPEVHLAYENMNYSHMVNSANSGRDTIAYWENRRGFEGFLHFQVLLAQNVFVSRFNLTLGAENKNIEYTSDYFSMPPGVFEISSVYSQVSFSHLAGTIRNIVPHSGIQTDLIYRSTVDFFDLRSDFEGEAIFGNIQLFYTPPIFLDFQFEVAARSLVRGGSYIYSAPIRTLPWGYSNSNDSMEVVFRVAVHYPLFFLESQFPFLPIYMDFLGVELFNEIGTSSSLDISLMDSFNQNMLTSKGVKFYLDMKIFGLFGFRPGISFYFLADNQMYRSFFVE